MTDNEVPVTLMGEQVDAPSITVKTSIEPIVMNIPEPKTTRVVRKRRKSRNRKTGGGLNALTMQQRRVYDYIRDSIRSTNKPPTLRNIAEAMGFRSVNGVMCHLNALQQKGVINREEGQTRGILISVNEPIRASRFGDIVILDCGDRVYELDTASASRLGQTLVIQSGVPLA